MPVSSTATVQHLYFSTIFPFTPSIQVSTLKLLDHHTLLSQSLLLPTLLLSLFTLFPAHSLLLPPLLAHFPSILVVKFSFILISPLLRWLFPAPLHAY